MFSARSRVLSLSVLTIAKCIPDWKSKWNNYKERRGGSLCWKSKRDTYTCIIHRRFICEFQKPLHGMFFPLFCKLLISLWALQTWWAAEVPGTITVSKNWLCAYAKLEIGWQKQFTDPGLAGILHERRQGRKPAGLTLQPAAMQHALPRQPNSF